jgi:Xaa-Pro dipeptidase
MAPRDEAGPTQMIPDREYDQRVERLQRRMHEERLNALLLGTGMNLHYFSGLPSPQRNVPRPFFLLIPASGDPILFSHIAFADETRRYAKTRDIRAYEGLSAPPIALLCEAIAEVGAGTGRIGMELGFEQSLDISPLDLRRLQDAFAPAEVIDAARMLWDLRLIKSENEIACMRQACEVVARAYQYTFERCHPGMREAEIYAVMLGQLQVAGNDLFLVITSGNGNYDLVSKPPEARTVNPGDMVWMDAGCRIDGYWSDYSRAAIAGAPSELQQAAQNAIHRVTLETIEKIRPGIRCSEVARFALQALDKLPFALTSSVAARAGRIGHGIGLTMTEPPHLGLHDNTLLLPGMTVTVEPGIATEYGTFHVEENVVVRDGPCEFLTSSPRELASLI